MKKLLNPKYISIFLSLVAIIGFCYPKAEAKTLRWKSMPIKVCIPKNQYEPLMKKAFYEWMKVTNGKVQFLYTCANPEITISYDANKQKSNAKYSFNGDGYIFKSHIEMGLKTKNGIAMEDELLVLLMQHEIGHSLGIQGHTKTPKSIMQPTVMKGYTITPDILAEINKRYK